MSLTAGENRDLLKIEGVSKGYGRVKALQDVSFTVKSGTIHAVLGENGAGKSTMMGILAGFITPDSGLISLDGVPLPKGDPAKTRRLGVEMVHQHFTLVPAFTVAENLRLFRPHGQPYSDPFQLARDLRWEIHRGARVGELPVGIQQRVEILRALAAQSSVLVLDEPTAVLTASEVDNLFEVLRKLKAEGKTILLIAHKLAEVIRVADRATILRAGKLVAEAATDSVTEEQLAEWMVGEAIQKLGTAPAVPGENALQVSALTVNGDRGEFAVRDVSFSVKAGEIMGIGGVDGNGQIELAEALACVRSWASGFAQWKERPLRSSDVSLGYIPQDRQRDGLALGMSVTDNLLIAGHRRKRLRAGPFLRVRKIREWAAELVRRFHITGMPNDLAGSLSGGNQQKVVVARTLEFEPELLVAVDPTRGLDIRATRYVQQQMIDAKNHGAAVVLFSSDLDELGALADRTMFMSAGKLTSGHDTASFFGRDE